MNIKVKKNLKTGADTTIGVLAAILRAMLGVLLVFVLTMAFFACIFAVYVKTNLSGVLELSLEDYSQSLSSVIYATDPDTGNYIELVAVQSTEYRIWLEYDEIPIDVEHALVAIEDFRFYRHYGVDWYRTTAAFVNMFLRMRNNFGGSTITQQLIKTLTGNDDATVARKFEEIFSALEFERTYSKDEIIQWYLNAVYFGKGAYGIAAAADVYFGKDVGELSVAEIASLIALPNNPSIYNPYSYPENNKKRQSIILEQMFIQDYIDGETYEAALAEELVFKSGKHTINNQQIYTWFEESVIDEVTEDLMELRGISRNAASMLLQNGGYSIYSTLNPNVQAAIDEVYEDLDGLPKTTGTKKQLQSSIVIVDPNTGYIAGLAGGVGEKTANRINNRATMDLGRRPAGSSIKPIAVYGPAMEYGLITPDTKFDDSKDIVLSGSDWLPHNDDLGWDGVMNIRSAIVKSRNVIAAQVLDKLTPATSFRFVTEKLGMELLPADEAYAPLSVGQLTIGTTAQEMASAYTIFPGGGVRTEAVTYTRIDDRNGNLVFENKPRRTVAISETTAYWMTSILHDAATVGTGSEANLGKMPTAGKTGTAGDNKDRWFVGYTPYYVAAVWSGYDQPEPIKMAKRGNPASQLWKRVMAKVHADLPVIEFSVPANIYQPPVPGIKEVEYTVKYQTESGTVFFSEVKTAQVGANLEITAPEFDRFEVVGDKSQTLIINENTTRNTVTFVYRLIASETPTPSPSPSPTPSEDTPEENMYGGW